MTIAISPKRVARFLACLVLTISAVGIGAVWLKQATASWSHRGLTMLADKFVLDGELSFPAWYSSLAIACCAVLLGVIAAFQHGTRSRFAWHWTGLTVIFAGLSFDEMAGMHEMLVVPLRRHLGAHGIFHYAWVIPAAVFVAVVALTYPRFVFVHLDARARRRFLVAGLVYVGAALGIEMAEGPIDLRFGVESVPAQAAVAVEETLEMLTIVYFMYALLSFIAEHVGEVRMTIRDGESNVGVSRDRRRVTDSASTSPRTDFDLTVVWNDPEPQAELVEPENILR